MGFHSTPTSTTTASATATPTIRSYSHWGLLVLHLLLLLLMHIGTSGRYLVELQLQVRLKSLPLLVQLLLIDTLR